MKAIITAAGLGKRSGLNGLIRKELLSVYDYRNGSLILRPIIDVLITKLIIIGISEIAVVLDPSDALSRDYLTRIFPAVKLYFQKEKNGFGDAVLAAREFIEDEGFLVAAGDGMVLNLESLGEKLREAERGRMWKLFVMRVEDPKRYGVAVLRNEGSLSLVTEVVEKPAHPHSNYALCALYYLPPQIFDFISYKEGQAELTSAISDAIKSGIRFNAVEVPKESWVSVGLAKDYRLVLEATYRHAMENSDPETVSKS
jgi:glucose-1-phosphate thymidylyltransferase